MPAELTPIWILLFLSPWKQPEFSFETVYHFYCILIQHITNEIRSPHHDLWHTTVLASACHLPSVSLAGSFFPLLDVPTLFFSEGLCRWYSLCFDHSSPSFSRLFPSLVSGLAYWLPPRRSPSRPLGEALPHLKSPYFALLFFKVLVSPNIHVFV